MRTDGSTAGNVPQEASLVPIDAVSRRVRLPASTIRYYEERGLVLPVSRHGGRRWYGENEIRRLAIIRHWQKVGRMSLDEIGEILAGPGASAAWQRVLRERIDALGEQIDSMRAARDHLEHVLHHHEHSPPDDCDYFEKLIWDPGAGADASHW
jgi:MerR family transcriptional regulator, copper efflux regulator